MRVLLRIVSLLPFKRKQRERQKMVRYLSQAILDQHQEEARTILIDGLKNQPEEVADYICSQLEELLVIYCWREKKMLMVSDYQVLVREILNHLRQELQIEEVPIS